MACAGLQDYLCRTLHEGELMADDDKKSGLLKGRLFLLIFFGLAILLSITTILGTWEEQREGVVDPSEINSPAAAPAPSAAPAAPPSTTPAPAAK